MPYYYFTFGTDPGYPFQNGWVKIQAPSRREATEIFAIYFPSRDDECVNCAFIYEEEEFKETSMYKKNDNLGAGCHCVIAPFWLN